MAPIAVSSCKKLYTDDCVYKFNKRKLITYGTVHDPDNRDDDSSESDDSTIELDEDEVMVLWNRSLKAEVCRISRIHLLSRNIWVQYCVTRLKNGKETQQGVCKEAKQVAVVQIVGTGKVVENIARNRLRPMTKLRVDEAVALGDKFGRIEAIDQLLKMKSKCGVTVEVLTSLNRNEIIDDWNETLCDDEFPYYPGQVVLCIPNDLRQVKWTAKAKFKKWQLKTDQKFTIESADITSVKILWHGGTEYEEVQGDDIEKLTILPEVSNLAIGDRYLLQIEPTDVPKEKKLWRKSPAFSAVTTDSRADDVDDGNRNGSGGHGCRTVVPVEVLCANCNVTVVWQDGTEEKNIPSTELHYLSDVLDDLQEFFPGVWVVPKHPDVGEKRGVVQKVNFAERVAEVKWFNFISETNVANSFEEIGTSEHSVYDLKQDPDYKFELGSVIVKRTPAGALLGKVKDRSPQGFLVVEWLDGTVENCWHIGNIELVPENETDIEDSSDDDSDVYDEPWVTVSDTDEVASQTRRSSSEERRDSVDAEEEECDPDPIEITEPSSNATKLETAFCVLDEAPETHQYYFTNFEPKNMQKFAVALQREYKLLRESLPNGVWVRAYEDRTDLLSVMIRGVENTPYEDGLFLFDVQLCPDYPKNPPQVHFISYISEQLNPNLYVEGVVCVSLLGTWEGRGSEVWGPSSNLLQLIVSIQGLILVAEPHYNEAGHEKQERTQQGYENSRTYNELVILKLVQSTTKLLADCPQVFRAEITSHFRENGEKMCRRIESYCSNDPFKSDFPLLPVSKGLKLSLAVALEQFRKSLAKIS